MSKKVEAPEVAEVPLKPKSKLKKILVLLVLVMLLGGGGSLAYIIFTDDPSSSKHPQHVEKHMMPLEPFLVNLADTDSRRYLKLKIELEVPSEKSAKELEKFLAPIRDSFILLLSSKSYQEIATPEGKLHLKQQLLKQMASIPGGKKVSGVYFTEFVAQ